jgi:hypothetical protein
MLIHQRGYTSPTEHHRGTGTQQSLARQLDQAADALRVERCSRNEAPGRLILRRLLQGLARMLSRGRNKPPTQSILRREDIPNDRQHATRVVQSTLPGNFSEPLDRVLDQAADALRAERYA